jgi:hypothetical protein
MLLSRIQTAIRASVPVAVLLTLMGGCQSRFKPTYPARGQVFYEGKPAAGAKVMLFSLDDPKDPILRPMAEVDDQGSFNLNSYVQGDGAPAGAYAVTVIWVPKGFHGDIQKANKLPARYSEPDTSELKITIEKKDNVLEPFHLTK